MATPLWYNAALALLKPIYQSRIRKRAEHPEQLQQELLERFGPFQPAKNLHAIWFHVVSVGETNAAQPLIEHYLKAGHPVLVTNTTKTGQARAKSLFLKAPYLDLFQAVYLPADQVHLIREFYQKYQPKLLALVETELWPNLIDQAQHFQVPCLLINARLSEKSAKGYAKVKGLTRGMLQNLQQLLAQDLTTQQRFIALGMPSERTKVVGNIKFDIRAPEDFVEQAVQLQQTWQLAHRKIITLASTHAPEEQQLLTALKPYFAEHPELLCIVVPRHPERFDEVAVQVQKLQLNMQRRSLAEVIQPDTQVYLADSMGEMWLWYALSQACYVGGSLNEPGGGHNILEPLALSVATVLGKNYFNFQSIVDEFVAAEAVYVVENAEQAVNTLTQLLFEPALRAQLNQNAQVIMYKNRGSLTEHIHVINQYL
ncbi:3-deoxy-D-manno-2-octulosonate transferase [Acinetobacter sp. KAM398]|uniref:3-deoxy-D-manno-octulosonic acid transferase n=1 Tax=unclassified Acinetobacter TaxID=196816 RepID=UPI001F2C105B|nr:MULTISPECIES: 3-deoxy-D-manno-octulosonic acid transferase [unclassified Acinetobacter]GJC30851.1 3-deoxy-D-manno-2-octulosonate transferase [Acinetobacter sp. KAM392]GJC33660.1 3-deoxy-D-manno-2-octulosonate transferase [Acinetobacter sp. KAM393]GJC36489.1 3-deoxy-D-manno-2-octulosonate transferase [Acinetobacter sp. KAM394]GJC39308.1 3-deoxy-D-manno-2-octulosonate transferase [Acinetobacter sp. KAM395]GJC42382.1 3-deoxy-D-manno-2-octulosonate transferase [Acinetobacter sp. KAM396]